jgi:serine/threonine protein kinase
VLLAVSLSASNAAPQGMNGALLERQMRSAGILLEEHHAVNEERYLETGPALSLDSGAPGQNIGPYRLISIIGHGGMGTVWLAERSDGRFERKAAVKFLNFALTGRGLEERFRREGAILGRLSHVNIAELLDAGVTAIGQPYLVIEHVEGDRSTITATSAGSALTNGSNSSSMCWRRWRMPMPIW